MRWLERFRFSRNHTKENALRCTSSTGSVKVGIALRSSSAANVGEGKDSDKRQQDAIAAQLRSPERKGAKHSIRGAFYKGLLSPEAGTG